MRWAIQRETKYASVATAGAGDYQVHHIGLVTAIWYWHQRIDSRQGVPPMSRWTTPEWAEPLGHHVRRDHNLAF